MRYTLHLYTIQDFYRWPLVHSEYYFAQDIHVCEYEFCIHMSYYIESLLVSNIALHCYDIFLLDSSSANRKSSDIIRFVKWILAI